MTVQDAAVRTVLVPRQAEPVDPAPAPAAGPAQATVPLLGRDRPLTTDERQFALGLALMVLVLGSVIVTGLLLGQYAWS